jgi:hypothetical protein
MFYDNKYTRWYYSIIDSAKSQQRIKLKKNNPSYVYYESHHIKPKSMGGTETVLLTAREHFICHLLLTRMCVSSKDQYKMFAALDYMMFKNKNQSERYINSYLYEKYKTGRTIPEEIKEKLRNHVSAININTGEYVRVSASVFHSSDHLVGVNHGKTGQKRSDEFKLNRTGEKNSFYGKTHSSETLENIGAKVSLKLKGKPKSEAHKAAMKAAWARRKSS